MSRYLRVLSLSDVLVPFIYSPNIRSRFNGVDLIIGCGDLPYSYQEYVVSLLDTQLFFVRGNHDKNIEYTLVGERRSPQGGFDLHCRTVKYRGLLLAGVEGSLRYRPGPYQYTQAEMWQNIFSLLPGIFRNKLLEGRYLDIFVTHAPPRGIHDKEDLTHRGINAFRWFIKVFKPAYHFHGHIHTYRPDAITETLFENTLVINTFGHRETILEHIPQVMVD